MHYRHTQFAPGLFRIIVIAFLICIAVISAASGEIAAVLIVLFVAGIVSAAMVVFGRLTVEVTDDGLRAFFGWGWPIRTLTWDKATAVRIVRNRWWYGFGIRWFPGGSLWNVWTLDAVEFDLATGRKLRIGTDQPDALLAALVGRVAMG
ncbi:MAG: hypothetical protein ACR2OI_06885 [Acidimicrobiia bacterium]